MSFNLKEKMSQPSIHEEFEILKMSLKGQLLTQLEHEWKQPLNFISTNLLHLEIKSEINKLNNQEVQTTINNIETAVEQISSNIRTLNELFISSQKYSQFTLKDMLAEIIEFFSYYITKYDISMQNHVEDVELNQFKNEYKLLILLLLKLPILSSIKQQSKQTKLGIYHTNKLIIEHNIAFDQSILEKEHKLICTVIQGLEKRLNLNVEFNDHSIELG